MTYSITDRTIAIAGIYQAAYLVKKIANTGTYDEKSYETCIAFKGYGSLEGALYLDRESWDYSKTTSRYRNQFTGLTTAQTKAGIKDGSIILTDLN